MHSPATQQAQPSRHQHRQDMSTHSIKAGNSAATKPIVQGSTGVLTSTAGRWAHVAGQGGSGPAWVRQVWRAAQVGLLQWLLWLAWQGRLQQQVHL
mmetsp:Transcript_19083/g.48487  ORF Transcript_19083/g.48487 Transcript_19083/m.48487 type:complete len:96 (+) Transcript_19083:280-567(+)